MLNEDELAFTLADVPSYSHPGPPPRGPREPAAETEPILEMSVSRVLTAPGGIPSSSPDISGYSREWGSGPKSKGVDPR